MEYSWEISSMDDVSNTMTVKYLFNTSYQAEPVLINMSRCPVGVNISSHIKMNAPITQLEPGGQFDNSIVAGQSGLGSVYVEQIIKPADITLADYKKLKLEEIAAARYKFETSGLSLNGSSIDTSRESQAILTAAYISLKNNLIQSVDWKDTSGVFVTLGLAEVEMLSAAVSMHVQAAFSKEKALTTQVIDATTKAEVDVIVW